jgi:hypothetical protein
LLYPLAKSFFLRYLRSVDFGMGYDLVRELVQQTGLVCNFLRRNVRTLIAIVIA